ncbi:hypothetical protein EFB08_13780 [Rufibacter latericius]|uniref:Uncharacterized protein n=1 Tax=Rufibacter latericius TaxID=2487040 RepID=A0A3M9ML29_9BACT|nr:hypothetical protein EFB08_13780 [Rufibacter latericius]
MEDRRSVHAQQRINGDGGLEQERLLHRGGNVHHAAVAVLAHKRDGMGAWLGINMLKPVNVHETVVLVIRQ